MPKPSPGEPIAAAGVELRAGAGLLHSRPPTLSPLKEGGMLELSWFIDRSRNTAPEGSEAGSGPLSWLLLRLPVTSAGGSTSAPVRALVLSDKYRIGEAPRLAGSEPADGGPAREVRILGLKRVCRTDGVAQHGSCSSSLGRAGRATGLARAGRCSSPLHQLQPTCQALLLRA